MEVTIHPPKQLIACPSTTNDTLEAQMQKEYAEEIQLLKSIELNPRAESIKYILAHLDPKGQDRGE